MVGVAPEEVLMRSFRRVEAAALKLGDDRAGISLGPAKLGDIRRRDAALLRVLREDGRAIAGAGIGALTVKLSGIVRDREINPQQRGVADLCGVVDDANRLGMAGALGRDLRIAGGRPGAAGIAVGDRLDALH